MAFTITIDISEETAACVWADHWGTTDPKVTLAQAVKEALEDAAARYRQSLGMDMDLTSALVGTFRQSAEGRRMMGRTTDFTESTDGNGGNS